MCGAVVFVQSGEGVKSLETTAIKLGQADARCGLQAVWSCCGRCSGRSVVAVWL